MFLARFLVLASASVLVTGAPAYAQSGQTAQIPLQFDFLNPGARSLGLGSSFVAIADDATSAFTNPAGLTSIVRREVSAELRFRRLDTAYLVGGRLSGTVTTNGVDDVVGPLYGISRDQSVRPYFLSFVYPMRRWSFAAYRHELVRQVNDFFSDGAFRQVILDGTLVINNARDLGLMGQRQITIDNYGASVGFRLSDRVSLGAGVALYRFELQTDFASLTFPAGQFEPADPATAGLSSTNAQSGLDLQPGVNVGMLFTVNSKVRVGAVYRSGVTFHFDQEDVVPGSPTVTRTGEFRIPSVIGAGVRFAPTADWVFAFEFHRIQYSRLRDDFIAFQVDPASLSTISVPDGNELHFAAEYTLLTLPRTPSIRVGAWYDPAHSVKYATDLSNSDSDIRLRSYFPASQGQWHGSFGIGLPLSRNFEVNAGADFTRARYYVSASVVARFGR